MEPAGGRVRGHGLSQGACDGGILANERMAPLLEALLEHLPLVLYVDEANELSSAVYMSKQIEPLLGYTVEEWQSDPELFVKCLHPDDRERVLAAIRRTTERRLPYSDEYRLVARDGRVLWFRDESVHVPGSRLTPGYLVDITARKRAEEEQSQRNEELEQLRDALRQELAERAQTEQALQDTVVRLRQSQLDLTAAHEEVIRRLSYAAEFRDTETGRHVERMSRYCALLAAELGLDEQRCELIGAAAALHDVGKIGVPDAILLKPGSLTPDERAAVERHAEIGHAILSGPGSPLLELAATIAWTHHERYDGSGYPRRLAGEQIPLEGRIAAVADVFDALTSDRPYRPAFAADEALRIMQEGRGTQFDPLILDLFVAIVGRVHSAELPGRGGEPAGDPPPRAPTRPSPRDAAQGRGDAAAGGELRALAALFAEEGRLGTAEAVADFAARTLGRLLELDAAQVNLALGATPYALAALWRRCEPAPQPLGGELLGRLAERAASSSEPLVVVPGAEAGLAGVAGELRAVCVPLRVGERAIGVLAGAGRLEPAPGGELADAVALLAQHAAALIERAQALDRERRAAATDALTGLFNRRGFSLRFREELKRAERGERELAVVVLDCDDLKRINAAGGTERGDDALQRVAGVLRSSKRLQDVAARLGGDEFAVLLPEVDQADALAAAERLRRVIAEQTLAEGQALTATFGVAVYPADGSTPDALLRAATRAMELAKRTGKNRALALGSASVAS